MHNRAVSLIYEAALDGSRWPDAITAVARAGDAGQVSLESYDPLTSFRLGLAPLTDPAFAKSYRDHYVRFFSPGRALKSHQVGKVLHGRDFFDDVVLGKTEYYNDWWKPQGMGGDTLMAKVGETGRIFATTICKRFGEDFTAEEERNFTQIVGHFRKAIQMANALELERLSKFVDPEHKHSNGVAIVNADRRILQADDSALSLLSDLGLLEISTSTYVRSNDGRVEKMVRSCVPPFAGNMIVGGYQEYISSFGVVRICAIPVSEGFVESNGWLVTEEPVAVLHLTTPKLREYVHANALEGKYGLTRREAEVALEIAKGDGRAATAHRLGISEATVRSHLSTIFEKLDIHRQAELVRIVSGG